MALPQPPMTPDATQVDYPPRIHLSDALFGRLVDLPLFGTFFHEMAVRPTSTREKRALIARFDEMVVAVDQLHLRPTREKYNNLKYDFNKLRESHVTTSRTRRTQSNRAISPEERAPVNYYYPPMLDAYSRDDQVRFLSMEFVVVSRIDAVCDDRLVFENWMFDQVWPGHQFIVSAAERKEKKLLHKTSVDFVRTRRNDVLHALRKCIKKYIENPAQLDNLDLSGSNYYFPDEPGNEEEIAYLEWLEDPIQQAKIWAPVTHLFSESFFEDGLHDIFEAMTETIIEFQHHVFRYLCRDMAHARATGRTIKKKLPTEILDLWAHPDASRFTRVCTDWIVPENLSVANKFAFNANVDPRVRRQVVAAQPVHVNRAANINGRRAVRNARRQERIRAANAPGHQ